MNPQFNSSTNHYRFPVTLHPNFCNKKTDELSKRGLWLLISEDFTNNLQCKPYNLLNTIFGQINMTKEYRQIQSIHKYIRKVMIKNGTFVRGKTLHGSVSNILFVIDYDNNTLLSSTTTSNNHNYKNNHNNNHNLVRRKIPDMETFLHYYGEVNINKVITIPNNILQEYPISAPIRSIFGRKKIHNTHEIKNKHSNIYKDFNSYNSKYRHKDVMI